MKLIKPSYEILPQPEGLGGVYKQIERAARVCYKSEGKITEDSYKGFVERMINSGHTATLEQGTVYLYGFVSEDDDDPFSNITDLYIKYDGNPYSKVNIKESDNGIGIYITTNLRVIHENNWYEDLSYICEPTEHHEKRVTVRFICSRSNSHQLVRHRSIKLLVA